MRWWAAFFSAVATSAGFLPCACATCVSVLPGNSCRNCATGMPIAVAAVSRFRPNPPRPGPPGPKPGPPCPGPNPPPAGSPASVRACPTAVCSAVELMPSRLASASMNAWYCGGGCPWPVAEVVAGAGVGAVCAETMPTADPPSTSTAAPAARPRLAEKNDRDMVVCVRPPSKSRELSNALRPEGRSATLEDPVWTARQAAAVRCAVRER